ncbi:MAG TPA: type II toxin-antitoxin system RelE/ParE family toxin [Clostridiaceae bacterium]|jgi:mRNA interferase RelE/StbE|nr:type II toxin-antitoxin system RelE/ParE family toxin [Clostridiaceae bacterium]
MKYKVLYTKKAIKQLSKIDVNQRNIILAWIEKNLVGIDNPKIHGKALKGNLRDYWRYRIGDYRIITEINDDKIKIIVVGIGHSKDIYERL